MVFLALLACLVFYTEAFKVSFYATQIAQAHLLVHGLEENSKVADGNMRRHPIGILNYSFELNVLTYSSGLSEGAVVESTGPVDDSTTVQFYSSDDCTPGTEISQGNGGCLTVDQDVVGAYKSFQVVASNSLASRLSKRRSPDQRRRPFRLRSAAEATPPAPNIYHGMDISFDGTEYKLLQIYANGYIGIIPDEWDDAIHTMNGAELFPEELVQNLTTREVDERDLVEALCNTFTTCTSRLGAGTVRIGDAVGPFFNSVVTAARAHGKMAVDFLKSPFFAQVAVGKSIIISSPR
jgi:hypothetical protein